MNGTPAVTQGPGCHVHPICGPKMVVLAIRVQDDIGEDGVAILVGQHHLAEAFQLKVFGVLDYAGAHHPLARRSGALHHLGQEVDSVIEGPKQGVHLKPEEKNS